MSRHYVLDGYNIIKQVPVLADKSLEDGRLGLIRWLNIHRPQGSVNNTVTVVFDGNPNFFGHHEGGDVRVIFSQYGSADDTIKEMVEHSSDKKGLVIVSDDKGIFLYVRALGAAVLSVKQFVGDFKGPGQAGTKAKARPIKGKAPQVQPGKYITLDSQAKINKEMSKLWLNE